MQGEGTLGHECPLGNGTQVVFDFSPMDMETGWLGWALLCRTYVLSQTSK